MTSIRHRLNPDNRIEERYVRIIARELPDELRDGHRDIALLPDHDLGAELDQLGDKSDLHLHRALHTTTQWQILGDRHEPELIDVASVLPSDLTVVVPPKGKASQAILNGNDSAPQRGLATGADNIGSVSNLPPIQHASIEPHHMTTLRVILTSGWINAHGAQ